MTSMKVSLPKFYADVCDELPPEYSDYENFEVHFDKMEQYELIRRIGRGKYSEVFEAIDTSKNNLRVVIKTLKPVKKAKIRREIMILKTLKGGPNIIKLYSVVRDPISKIPALITEFVELKYKHFYELYKTFTEFDIKFYIYEVLKALDYCHSKGVIHRDIKPQNIMIDSSRKKLRVIDWGLAEFYHKGQNYNCRVASRFFKGPELLLDYNYYDYSLDMWSLGCVLAGLIFKKEPFFEGENNDDQLVKIAKVLGTEDLWNYCEKYNIMVDEEKVEMLQKHTKKKYQIFANSSNQHLINDTVLDLIEKMLLYDHAERITPKEAMQHEYFYDVLAYHEKLKEHKPMAENQDTAEIALENASDGLIS